MREINKIIIHSDLKMTLGIASCYALAVACNLRGNCFAPVARLCASCTNKGVLCVK